MDITPRIAKHRQRITGYGVGGFKINDEWIEGSLIVLPDQVLHWDVNGANLSHPDNFKQLIDLQGKIELLLLGTGSQMQLVDKKVRVIFKDKGIAIDTMDTGAACRTYNVLLAEERKVGVALVALTD